MKFTLLINNYSPKYIWLQCCIFTGLQSGEVNIHCKPPTLTEVNIGLVYTQTVRQKKHKKMISIHLFLQGLQYFQAQICTHCSEVNRKGQLEFEWPIRLHLKCYPIFQHISVPDIHISYPQTAWSSILHIGATNGGSVPQLLIKSIFHLHDSF